MRKRRSKSRQKKIAEMEITAFMNLMVVLVPFLLITAVFTKMSILDLKLPKLGDSSSTPNKPEMELQIIIRENAITLNDSIGGPIKTITRAGASHDYKTLNIKLKEIKSIYASKTNATILAEKDTHYDTIVQVMDAVRMYTEEQGKKPIQYELFPDISIGDAPK